MIYIYVYVCMYLDINTFNNDNKMDLVLTQIFRSEKYIYQIY